MSTEKGSSKTDTLVKVVLVFFISLLSFSVGTFVGKQVSDSDHRRMALESEYKGDRQVASSKDDVSNVEPSEKITEKEVETLTEEFVNKEKSATTTEPAMAAETESTSTTGAIDKAADKTADKPDGNGYKTYKRDKVAMNKKAAEVTATMASTTAKVAEVTAEKTENTAETGAEGEDRKPSSTLPSVASSAVGKFTVQVGAFPDEKEAKARAADLKGKGWNAFYFAANVQGHTWYRVSVGLFNNMSSADKFRAEFMKDSGTKSALVRKVIQ